MTLYVGRICRTWTTGLEAELLAQRGPPPPLLPPFLAYRPDAAIEVGFAGKEIDWRRQTWERGWRVVRRVKDGLDRDTARGALFEVQRADGVGVPLVVHAARIRPAATRERKEHQSFWRDNSEAWNIGTIVDARNNDAEFLVVWEGWDTAYNSWEPAANIIKSAGNNQRLDEYFARRRTVPANT